MLNSKLGSEDGWTAPALESSGVQIKNAGLRALPQTPAISQSLWVSAPQAVHCTFTLSSQVFTWSY